MQPEFRINDLAGPARRMQYRTAPFFNLDAVKSAKLLILLTKTV